jgi:hypothetical protein
VQWSKTGVIIDSARELLGIIRKTPNNAISNLPNIIVLQYLFTLI